MHLVLIFAEVIKVFTRKNLKYVHIYLVLITLKNILFQQLSFSFIRNQQSALLLKI